MSSPLPVSVPRNAPAVSFASPAAPSPMLPVPLVSPVVAPSALRRVLLVKLSSLGDVVHALPLAEALRTGLSADVQITWAVRAAFAPLLRGNPNVDSVSILTKRGFGASLRFGRGLRADHFDAALDTQGLFVSGMLTYLSGAPIRIGLDRNREGNRGFLTHPIVPARQRVHIVDALMGFCDALGIPRVAPRPQRYLADGAASPADALLREAGLDRDGAPTVGFIVGASTPDKTWPVARWAETARRLSDAGVRVVLLGGGGEAATGAAIAQAAPPGSIAADLTGQTPLPVLASVLARCGVVIGGDSGPTHLAVGVGTPVVGLYGVTDPAKTGPCWGPAPALVLDFATEDAPPEQRRPRHGTVPDALARIPAWAAAEAALSLLSGNARQNDTLQ